jgi:hypothetical protein
MKKSLVLCVLLAAFAWTSTSYGMGRVLVYKGTIKASNTVFDVNDTNNFAPLSVQGYWVVELIYTDVNEHTGVYDDYYAFSGDSNAVIYDKKREWIKMIPESLGTDWYDSRHIGLFSFDASDADGSFAFDVTGKGKLIKDSNDPIIPKTYVPTTLKGAGLVTNFDFFTPFETYSGPVTVTLTLDTKLTLEANSNGYDVDETLNNIIDKLTAKGTWANWPYLPPGP